MSEFPESLLSTKMTSPDRRASLCSARLTVRGKFFFLGEQKIYLRGVSFGPFAPPGEDELGNPEGVAADFRKMKTLNINCVRTYAVPDRWFLDLSYRHDLRVLVGIPWPQHIAFLDDTFLAREIEKTVASAVRRHLGHPSILGYAIGNEIPASIVRWHGPRKVEKFLSRLYMAAKTEDPDALVTYVNYPTTEYLNVPFLDFISFNIYLEDRKALQAYLYRLQNICGEHPLVLTELGLDTMRNSESSQAELLGWQIRDLFAAACAGGFIFSWTDEWYRGGSMIADWSFGLTTRDRIPKPATEVVRSAFSAAPFAENQDWPAISVVVCVHNGKETIRQCLQRLAELNYPDYEVIVIDDGSKDGTAEIITEYAGRRRFRFLRTENRGLSAARNLGLENALGEIVAFIDADAYPDREWLRYYAADFQRTEYLALGGPNLPTPDRDLVSTCVAASPGWPTHVLLSDRDAEHIPGCNMAFRKEILKGLGGFDPQFRTAGDDVDFCWRMSACGYSIGFCHGALVWHYPRRTIGAYWRQQRGYGFAEALLEHKWPEKYHGPGQINWAGRIYRDSSGQRGRGRIYYGCLGLSPFQSVYHPVGDGQGGSVLAPLYLWLTATEWNLAAGVLVLLSLLSPIWPRLYVFAFLLSLRIVFQMYLALASARAMSRQKGPAAFRPRIAFTLTTAVLHLLQPVARFAGRLGGTRNPWLSGHSTGIFPLVRTAIIWNEKWQLPQALLAELVSRLKDNGAVLLPGGGCDRWDLHVQAGAAGAARIRIAHEEHAGGRQLIRIRCWPYWPRSVVLLIFCINALAALAAVDYSVSAGLILGFIGIALAIRALLDAGYATRLLVDAVNKNAGIAKRL